MYKRMSEDVEGYIYPSYIYILTFLCFQGEREAYNTMFNPVSLAHLLKLEICFLIFMVKNKTMHKTID